MNLKQMVGIEAAKYVEDGMIVGLGTGSTAKFMVDEIGRRVKEGLSIVGVTTSKETEKQALALGIPLKVLMRFRMWILRLMAPMKSALIFRNQRRWRCLTFEKLWPLIQRNVFGLWINQKWWTI